MKASPRLDPGRCRWVEDDGGRKTSGIASAPRRKNEVRDCVVRAIAIATGKPYREIHDALTVASVRHAYTDDDEWARYARRRGGVRAFDPDHGCADEAYFPYLESLGWRYTSTKGGKAHLRADELPRGRLIVSIHRHLVAVVDHVIHDTHDCGRDGRVPVKGYWIARGQQNEDKTMSTKEYEFHPLADIFPLMEGEEFDALVADIKANGLLEKIDLYRGKIVEGRNRYRALRELGIDPSTEPKKYFRKAIYAHTTGGEIAAHEQNNDAKVRAYIISKNIHRRHLTSEQKRELIAKLIKDSPEKSNRQIAATVKADHKTVASVRAEKESRGEIPHVETRTDTRGRRQPAKKPPAVVVINDPEGPITTILPNDAQVPVEAEEAALLKAWNAASFGGRSAFVLKVWKEIEAIARLQIAADTRHY